MPEAPSNDDSESPSGARPPIHAITKAHRPIAAQLNHHGDYAPESRKDKAERFGTLSKDEPVSPKGLLAAKQKLLPRLQHVQPQPGGGLKFALFEMGLFCSREIDEDYVALA